jgi:valyl-tRNA synthetase
MTEPWISKQWFVKIAPLAARAIEVVNNGKVKIIPERFTRVYLNWMENIRDWCISRQLWWGHQIPVWYCNKCGEIIASIETPLKCTSCDSDQLIQESDVLDTWFSSALWPHSTLGWPKETEDLKYFYPTSVMVTGYDILFFWVARMIMMGLEDMDDIPFEYVFLNGLIRDEKGHKMSKVRGNVINPLTVINKYGTDALRFAVTTGCAPGNDINIGEGKLEAARNFANKLWNASRFVLQNLEKQPVTLEDLEKVPVKSHTYLEDRWILSRLGRLTQNVSDSMNNFLFGDAERELYEFIWGEYCDWYIEIAKQRLSGQEESPMPVLIYVLEKTLRLLHPFMPFITEEIWQNIKARVPGFAENTSSIMIAEYPLPDGKAIDTEAERIIEAIIEIVRSIRNVRAEYKVDIGKWITATVYSDELTQAFAGKQQVIEVLSHARPLSFKERKQRENTDDKTISVVLQESEVVIPLAGMVDIDAEKKRLGEEVEKASRDINRLETRLADQAFLSKAPTAVVEKERERLQMQKDRLERLQKELAALN